MSSGPLQTHTHFPPLAAYLKQHEGGAFYLGRWQLPVLDLSPRNVREKWRETLPGLGLRPDVRQEGFDKLGSGAEGIVVGWMTSSSSI